MTTPPLVFVQLNIHRKPLQCQDQLD